MLFSIKEQCHLEFLQFLILYFSSRSKDKSKHAHYRKKSKTDKLDKYKDSLSEGLQIDVSDSEEEYVN